MRRGWETWIGIYEIIDQCQRWLMFQRGTSIGDKNIDIFNKAVSVTGVQDTPKWRSVSLRLCDYLVGNDISTGRPGDWSSP